MKSSSFSTSFNTIFLLVVGLLSAVLGFVREIQIASYFGLTNKADMYYLGSLLPDLIVAIIGSTTTNIYMREYNHNTNKKSYTTSVLVILTLIVFLLLIIIEILFPYIATIISPTYRGDNLNTFISVGRIMVASIAVSVLLGVIVGTLNINGKFILTGFNGLIYNILLIASTSVLVPFSDIYGLAWSYLIANVARGLLLLTGLKGCIGKIDIKSTFPLLKETPQMAITNLILNFQSNIERNVASTIKVGAVSALNYAGRIAGLPSVLFINSVLTVTYPKFIECANKGDSKNLAKSILFTLKIIVFGLICAELFFILFNQEIISVFLQKGKFTKGNTDLVSSLLILYAPVVILSGANQVLMKAAYSIGKTSLTVKAMVTALIIYGISVFVFKLEFGIYGLTIALIIYNLVMCLVIYVGLKFGENAIKLKLSLNEWYSILLFVIPVLIIKKILFSSTIKGIIDVMIYGSLYFILFIIFMYLFDKDIRKYTTNSILSFKNIKEKIS